MTRASFCLIPSVVCMFASLLFFSTNASADLLTLDSAQQSSTGWSGDAARAIDGNTSGRWRDKSTTHTNSTNQPWWSAELGNVAQIDEIELWNRTNNCCRDRLSDFYLLVSETPFATNDLSALLEDEGVWSSFHAGSVDEFVSIPVGVTGRYVRVQLQGKNPLSLAEVQVFGGLAENPVNEGNDEDPVITTPESTRQLVLSSAAQSSTKAGGVASRAIDGNTDGNWRNRSVTHTASGDSQAWWGATLESSGNVTEIELWNRTNNCCLHRLSNFYVFLSDTPFTSTDIEETLNDPNVWSFHHAGTVEEFLKVAVNAAGRYIRVQLEGTGVLSLAEVVVYGQSGGDLSAPSTPPPSNFSNDPSVTAQYSGVSNAMWNEIESVSKDFGDENNCRARVNSIPTSGYDLAPCDGDCINQALAANNVVRLLPGRYRISETIRVWGSKLIGAHPTDVIIDASDVDVAISVTSYGAPYDGAVANLTLENARNIGVDLGNDTTLHRLLINRTGAGSDPNIFGVGVYAYGREDNCIVSVAANHGYNEDPGQCTTCPPGGNSDGFSIANGGGKNTLIDSHASSNSDDGIDFWQSASSNFIYFSSAFNNGKPVDGRPGGDGNGFKLGRGNVRHYVYKSTAYNNLRGGFDRNDNTVAPLARSSEAFDNASGQDWIGEFVLED